MLILSHLMQGSRYFPLLSDLGKKITRRTTYKVQNFKNHLDLDQVPFPLTVDQGAQEWIRVYRDPPSMVSIVSFIHTTSLKPGGQWGHCPLKPRENGIDSKRDNGEVEAYIKIFNK